MSDDNRRETRDDEATIDEALRLMKPTAHVTEPVKAALATELPGVAESVSAIAQMTPLRLAAKLIGTEGVEEDDLVDIASDLIASFRKMLGLDSAPSQPAGGFNVTVAIEKRLDELTPRELLIRLAGDPSQFDDIATALRATRLVRQAGQSPWVIPAAGGGVDAARTAEYLEYLSRPGSIPQRLWPARGGARPESLESVFDRETRLMLNAFTGRQFSGLDEWGNDWNALPEKDHLAMLWAVATRHRNLPSAPDARRLTDDLFAKKRPVYMREIVEDFEEARRHDPQLASMSRYFTDGSAAGLSPHRTEEGYRELLLGAAQSRRSSMSSDIRLGEMVVESFKTMSGDVSLRGTTVLGDSSTMSGDLRGTAYVPRGVRISTMSGDDSLEVYERSYEDLARRRGLV